MRIERSVGKQKAQGILTKFDCNVLAGDNAQDKQQEQGKKTFQNNQKFQNNRENNHKDNQKDHQKDYQKGHQQDYQKDYQKDNQQKFQKNQQVEVEQETQDTGKQAKPKHYSRAPVTKPVVHQEIELDPEELMKKEGAITEFKGKKVKL